MRRSFELPAFLLACALLSIAPASAQWQPVAPGIDYQSYTIDGPNNVFVTRMDHTNLDCTIDTCIGQGRLVAGRETVSSMAEKHEDAIGYWGQSWGLRYNVVAAINGDFFSWDTGAPTSGQITSGWYAKRFGDFTGGSGFAWQLDRDAFIGECVRHFASKQKVGYPATGDDQNINGVNTERGSNELILYTHHYDLTTGTDDTGAEVLVQMTRPTLILPLPAGAVGTVVEIREDAGSTVIPFDHVVLSAHGTAAAKLLSNVELGAEVKISQEITHYEHDCETPIGLDWTKTYASVGGSFHFLQAGEVQTFEDPGATARHPRTAIALNDDYVYFVVVDGRSPDSIGMNMTELGTFCLDYLGAVEGINQDGGGSSTMWVNGEVVNEPSDGSERAVANGVLMIVTQPMEASTRFNPGDGVRTTTSIDVRVGPGLNYAVATSVPSGSVGTILAHDLAGIRATNTNWWKCDFAGVVGWFPETALLDSDCAGDYTADGMVGFDDLAIFSFCMQGPDLTYPAGTFCLGGDADADLDIDHADFATFQRCFASD